MSFLFTVVFVGTSCLAYSPCFLTQSASSRFDSAVSLSCHALTGRCCCTPLAKWKYVAYFYSKSTDKIRVSGERNSFVWCCVSSRTAQQQHRESTAKLVAVCGCSERLSSAIATGTRTHREEWELWGQVTSSSCHDIQPWPTNVNRHGRKSHNTTKV